MPGDERSMKVGGALVNEKNWKRRKAPANKTGTRRPGAKKRAMGRKGVVKAPKRSKNACVYVVCRAEDTM